MKYDIYLFSIGSSRKMSNGLVKVIDYIVNRFISAICDGNSKTFVNPKSKVTEITIANQKDG